MENLPDERRLPLTREQYLLNFGAETGFRNAIEGGGLRPTILGIKRDYDCFDINFRRYAGERWTVKYDPDDLGEVLAVSEDGSLRFMLTEKYVQPMALADRKPGDAAELQKVMQFNRDLEHHVTEQLAAQLPHEIDRYKDALTPAIILMTDGVSDGDFSEFQRYYEESGLDVPIFSIMFGSADPTQLEDLAELSNARVFDGREDLLGAFRSVKGYN